MEVADLYLLNKADLPGAHQALAELRASLPPASPQSWQPPVLPVVATQGEGLADVWEAILAHRRALEAGGQGQARRLARARHQLVHQVEAELHARLAQFLQAPEVETAVRKVVAGTALPGAEARRLVEQFLTQSAPDNGR